MNTLEITDIFYIPKKGVVVTGRIDDTLKHEFTIGERVKIVRPDGTHIFSKIHGVEKFYISEERRNIGVLLDAEIGKKDVPLGSVMTIIDFQ